MITSAITDAERGLVRFETQFLCDFGLIEELEPIHGLLRAARDTFHKLLQDRAAAESSKQRGRARLPETSVGLLEKGRCRM